jgi:lipopolysaccharide export system permease protein
VAAFNPLSAVMKERFNELDQFYFGRSGTVLRVDENGLWLREPNETGQTVIFAARASDNGMQLHDVTVMNIRPDATFGGRLDAGTAVFDNGALVLSDVDVTGTDKKTHHEDSYRVATSFSLDRLLENFSPPETVPFWRLPSFISSLERSGFSALRHRLQFYSLLATPALFAGMALLAASFSLRLPRRGGLGILALLGAVVGFGFFFATDVMRALAEAGTIPALLAAWIPAGIGILAGVTLLLHLEDG